MSLRCQLGEAHSAHSAVMVCLQQLSVQSEPTLGQTQATALRLAALQATMQACIPADTTQAGSCITNQASLAGASPSVLHTFTLLAVISRER